jgi:prevent-host-death family protein
MESYTAKEAKNRLGEVLRAALREPVVITVHGKPSVCVMPVADAEEKLRAPRNSHDVLDAIKHKISCEVLAMFPVREIKMRAKANIDRWRANDAGDPVYDEWYAIIEDADDTKMIAAMVGLSETSNRLRQSFPYVGMLPKPMVRKLNEEISA